MNINDLDSCSRKVVCLNMRIRTSLSLVNYGIGEESTLDLLNREIRLMDEYNKIKNELIELNAWNPEYDEFFYQAHVLRKMSPGLYSVKIKGIRK